MKALHLLVSLMATAAVTAALAAQPAVPALPRLLSETGLFAAGSTTVVRAEVIAFAPQYPLWSDGTRKQRWIRLPRGRAIDAAQQAF